MKIERLGGGITNRNYKLTAGGESFVLRIGGNDTGQLGIDRTMEHAASVNAAALGIGPQVVDFLEPEGFLITRFVEGEPGRIDLEEALALLRRLHDGPPIPGRFDSFRVVEAYSELARPAKYDWAHGLAKRIEARLGVRPLVPCHNDLLPANFIDDGDRLWLIDWDYAGFNSPLFDLGNLCSNNDVAEADEKWLLEAYFERLLTAEVWHRYQAMKCASLLREAMWSMVAEHHSTLDFDYVAYTNDYLARFERAYHGLKQL